MNAITTVIGGIIDICNFIPYNEKSKLEKLVFHFVIDLIMLISTKRDEKKRGNERNSYDIIVIFTKLERGEFTRISRRA